MAKKRAVSEGLEHEDHETCAQTKPYACDLCGRMLHSEEDLRRHRKICQDAIPTGRDNDQPQQSNDIGELTCEFCESKFRLQQDLRNHQNHCSVRQRSEGR